MSPKQIQQNLAMPDVPDQMGVVEVPIGALLDEGPVGANGFGPGNTNITQYRLMENIPSSSFLAPSPLVTPTIGPIETPMQPIEPIEPLDFPEIIP